MICSDCSLDIHAYPHGDLPKVGQLAAVEPWALARPRGVGVVEERLAVVGHLLAAAVNNHQRVVVLGSLLLAVGLFGVPHGDGATVFTCSRACPLRAGASPRGLDVGYDVFPRLEVVSCQGQSENSDRHRETYH